MMDNALQHNLPYTGKVYRIACSAYGDIVGRVIGLDSTGPYPTLQVFVMEATQRLVVGQRVQIKFHNSKFTLNK